MASGLAVERRGDALWLRLDRPEKLNAIDLALRDALWEALTLARDDSTLRVVVIEGAGDRAFSTGADISEFGTAPSLLDARASRLRRDVWGLLSSLVPDRQTARGRAHRSAGPRRSRRLVPRLPLRCRQ